MKMEEAEAVQFLESLLGKTLHVTVPDGTIALNQLRWQLSNRDRSAVHRDISMYGQRKTIMRKGTGLKSNVLTYCRTVTSSSPIHSSIACPLGALRELPLISSKSLDRLVELT